MTVLADPDRLDAALRDQAIERLLDDAPPTPWSEVHPYKKWGGAHWRLISAVELGVRGDPRTEPMLDRVLAWLAKPRRFEGVPVVQGRARRCASQEGNALWVTCHLGRADDGALLAEHLVRWQWPDGGWNCDQRPAIAHSSFHETVWPLRGLLAYHEVVGDPSALDAARRAGELLLRHRLFRSERTGTVIDPQWLDLHWPPTWRYDVFQGLRALAKLGWVDREEATDALDWLCERRRDDGTWTTSGRRWWKRPGSAEGGVEVVDWGELGDQIVTAHAEAVLRSRRPGPAAARATERVTVTSGAPR